MGHTGNLYTFVQTRHRDHIMNLYVRHIFIKAAIILMAFSICLPCSVKREIKQILDIPVSNLANTTKPNKTLVCQVFLKEITKKVSVSYQKKTPQKHPFNSFVAFFQNNIFKQHAVSFVEIQIATPVPIYILHEQYLI